MIQQTTESAQLRRDRLSGRADSLEFTACEGKLHTQRGQRAFLTSDDFLAGLRQGLAAIGRDTAGVLYQCGWKWGQHEMRSLVPRVEQEQGRSVQEMDAALFLEQWWASLQSAGWGAWEPDMSQRKHGVILIDLTDSAQAGVAGLNERTGCHLYAGLFAGVFSYLTKTGLAGLEIECCATGAACCKFIVGTQKRISTAQALFSQGATVREIMNRLLN
jgi:predicted hydrocarbon binding protein